MVPRLWLRDVAGQKSKIRLVRPLLQARKQHLLQLCKEQGLLWIEDPTNQDTSFLRNLIRRWISKMQPPLGALSERPSFDGEQKEPSCFFFKAVPPLMKILSLSHLSSLGSSKGQPGSAEAGLKQMKDILPLAEGMPGCAGFANGMCEGIVEDILHLSTACARARKELRQRADALIATATHLAHETCCERRSEEEEAPPNAAVKIHLSCFASTDRSTGMKALSQLAQVRA